MDPILSAAYVSLGPTCLPAEILKAGCLRTCTFGFDWFRSGEYFIRKFLSVPDPSEFVDRFVLEPHIPLAQISPPDASNSNTAAIGKAYSIYGFDYLYNPHRPLYENKTLSYFYRSFERLHRLIYDSTAVKHFFLADYKNKHNHSFLLDPVTIVSSLRTLFESSCIINFDITLLRLELKEYRMCIVTQESLDVLLVNPSELDHEKYCDRIVNISIDPILDDEVEYRLRLYKSLSRRLFPLTEQPLWISDKIYT